MIASYIKPKGMLWFIIPFSGNLAHTIYPYIYLPKAIYNNLSQAKPNIHYLALVAHEEFHIRRQKKMGIFLWGLRYLFQREFRFQEELCAYLVQKDFLKKHGVSFDTNTVAKRLSGPLYLWSASYKKAKSHLNF